MIIFKETEDVGQLFSSYKRTKVKDVGSEHKGGQSSTSRDVIVRELINRNELFREVAKPPI